MASTINARQGTGDGSRDTRLLGCAAMLALSASLAVMLLATPGSVPAPAYWFASSVALAVALAVLVLGERSWDRMVASAQAAGLVGR
ncbi:hypothetical protein Mycch_4159 [Mycolicibacterium chubuense NBB4]|uniref:Uncharacterized protein n=1 Tax=Mycolicibacterium chubuense (strain NBB4) TaxID=710421 RepID=I4BNM0_MYCCN|nr:hypothetical protein [Mycolicibacterium chubuense]AFM18877.1 hypothetical protein Mycch_4159 [Mycolicibacterium chubuense NBB4]